MVTEKTSNPAAPPRPTALITFLSVLAVVLIAVGLAGGLVILGPQVARSQIDPETALWVIIWLAGSCCLAGMLWAAAWLCRQHYHQSRTARQIASALERLAAEGQISRLGDKVDSPVAPQAERPEAILEQLRELNINLLLTENQRLIKGRYLAERRTGGLKRQLTELVSAGDLVEAEKVLDRLFHLAPDLPELPAMRERIEQARAAAEANDVAEAGGQVENLMAAGDFDRADSVAAALLAKHPDSDRADDLVVKVRRERETFVTERRAGMYRKIEKAASGRHWRSALVAARELLDAYPNSTEADAVRTQLSTITDNAQIEEVRALRDSIADLITRRRFGEAVETARDVIQRFPETAAAEELSRQLSRLEELAKSEQDKSK